MYLKHLEINNFRRFETASQSFSSVLNFLSGDNAKGKTTILEAIHLLCLARSFRTRSDAELCCFKKSNYQINGTFCFKNLIERKVVVSYSESSGRSIAIGGKPVLRYSQLIGNFPAIALSSQDHRITTGPPAERRRFADILLCQLSTRYLADLKEYYRVLKQRNQILQNISQGKKVSVNEMEPWNYELVKKGSEIIKARQKVCLDLTEILENVYHRVAGSDVKFEIQYLPSVNFSSEDIENAFQKSLKQTEIKEKNLGFCLVGPHRDDFLFKIDNNELRRFGSRGEHKTALISLKAAEAKILGNRKDETPVLLLDDLFAELDEKRSDNVLEVFENGFQIIVTTTPLERKNLKVFQSYDQPELKVFEFNDDGITSVNGISI